MTMMPLPPQQCGSRIISPSRERRRDHHGNTSRSGKRRRPPTRSSQSNDAPGESSDGQAQDQAAATAVASRRCGSGSGAPSGGTTWTGPRARTRSSGAPSACRAPTFGALCDALGGAVAKMDTALRTAIPVPPARGRLPLAPRHGRASPRGLPSLRPRDLHQSQHRAQVYQPWPRCSGPRSSTGLALTPLRPVAARFEAAFGLAGIVGALYTTRVPIVAPKANVAAYYDCGLTERNQKASYSVAVQAVADADGVFTNVWIGPGSLSDAAILGRSALSGLLAGGHGQGQRLVVARAIRPWTGCSCRTPTRT
ncbi:PIF/Ping-Pong transposase family protein [Zea mays]|uniref:PIF/Ping-Pong transposase family protein n=1 Tax=Zea mays TaxID=4577 RepID=A0A1D6FQM7_MAIZE|nr:PIF/Ping-Pong transposase family protein [Zea mays]